MIIINVIVQPRGNTETVVITGGTRGIGAEVVKKLLQCNMHVIIGNDCNFLFDNSRNRI